MPTAETSQVDEGDDPHDGVFVDRTTGDELPIDPPPPVMMQLLRDGGLDVHVRPSETVVLE